MPQELAFYARSGFSEFVTTAVNSVGFRIRAGNGSQHLVSLIQDSGSSTISVLCIRSDAPFLATRTSVSSGASDSTKDSQCSSEWGPEYQAAQLMDLGINHSPIEPNKFLVLAGKSVPYRVEFDSTYLTYSTDATSSGSHPVLCVRGE
jgi:hypothetical protein